MEGFSRIEQWKVGAQAEAPTEAMAESPRHDQELLRQLAKGNETAFRTLYECYKGRIFRFVLHMSGNNAIAEEVTQDVFVQLIENPKNYRPKKGEVASYLFGIARNLTRRRIKKLQLDIPIGEIETAGEPFDPAGEADLLEELSRVQLIEGLRRAILSLPEVYREALVLCDLEEMSYETVSSLLSCSQGTVASRLHRARAILKSKLTREKCAQ